jgi:ethanolamine utilization protein
MRVTEMEQLIQIITDKICLQSTSSQKLLALTQEKAAFPPALFRYFKNVSWTTVNNEHASGLVVKNLTIQQISGIANLSVSEALTQDILSFILRGKPVLVLATEANQLFKETMKYQLKKTIHECLDKCQRFGLYFYHSERDFEAFWSDCQKRKLPANTPTRSYITEKQLQQLLQKQEPLPKNQRLTPLARDYAIQHQLLIEEEKRCF